LRNGCGGWKAKQDAALSLGVTDKERLCAQRSLNGLMIGPSRLHHDAPASLPPTHSASLLPTHSASLPPTHQSRGEHEQGERFFGGTVARGEQLLIEVQKRN